ncbi:MAG: DUF354 domain-containing protein [Bacteroidales bacterium]|jgi:predicted glycosyltransferase|nr:DUF354 domain-containing protein [Bacteroidales bacterium]
MRNILLEVNHPGQVHLFKYIYKELINNGNKVTVTTKENKTIEYLLNRYDIPYQTIGKKKNGIVKKILNQLIHDYNTFKIVRKNKINIGIGSSITNDHLSAFTSLKSIHFSDDDEYIVPYISKFSYPFSDLILSPDSLYFPKFHKKNIGYAGTHELAYLHPKRFTPDVNVIKNIGLTENDTFFVLRFVALTGHHDAGHKGISIDHKRELINYLKSFGKIFITSEKEIEPEFEQYRLPVAPHEIHSLLYYATMFMGDSQTMTTEAAILGTPAIKCNTFAGRLSVPNNLESEHDICYAYQPDDFDKFMDKVKSMLENSDIKKEWKEKVSKFLETKIDVTAFMVWFIENYPESEKIMRDNPDYQYNFK